MYLLFNPIYQERVWGGQGFAEKLGRALPKGRIIGESWEIVDRPEAQSVVSAGAFTGIGLRTLLKQHSHEIMGSSWDPKRPFPLLIKWLDCHERLSLQVHPPASAAKELGGEPKTEHWYIADTKPGAAVFAGVKAGISKDTFQQSLKQKKLESCVNRLATQPGDALLIKSGCLHAIDAGNLIIEIQQNSDTTYRAYDWGRTGLDGKPRSLHVEESLKCIDFNDNDPKIIHTGEEETVLANCPEFRIRKITWTPHQGMLQFNANSEPRVLSVIAGKLVDSQYPDLPALSTGMNALLPYSGSFSFLATEPTTLLITDHFTHT